jgi:hypothetical protein
VVERLDASGQCTAPRHGSPIATETLRRQTRKRIGAKNAKVALVCKIAVQLHLHPNRWHDLRLGKKQKHTHWATNSFAESMDRVILLKVSAMSISGEVDT